MVMEVEGKGGVREVGRESEGRKEQSQVNPLSLSKGREESPEHPTSDIVIPLAHSLSIGRTMGRRTRNDPDEMKREYEVYCKKEKLK